MNRDDIIKLAREATDHLPDADSIRLQGIVLLSFDAGAAVEREACAKVCETEGIGAKYQGDVYAAAIRARGQK